MTATDDLFFAEEIDSGYECFVGHSLRLVAEGYALCHGEALWFAWRMTPPAIDYPAWFEFPTHRGAFRKIRWIAGPFSSRGSALDYIRADIEAHRNLPPDEENARG